VEEGIARVRRPAGVDEDEPFTVVVDIGHTAVEVPVGHRLRLEVSSSNFPKYDRNPNTGENPFTATELRPATQCVHHGPGHRSRLVLPVRRKPLVADARSRRPLVEPVANGETDEIAAVAAAGDDVAALLEQARDDLEADQVDRAVATLERVLELRPEDADGHYWLARAYLVKLNDASMFKKLGYSKKVRAGYGRALELDPDHGDAREGLAQYLFNAPAVAGGSFEKGLEQARELERREPLRAHVLLGQVYTRRKDYAAALGEYEAALGLAPEDADLHYRVGLVCQLDERWDRAFAEFERAIALGDDLRSLYQIGRTGVFSGQRLAQAREALEDYVAREPDSERLPSVANALWRLGMIHELEQHDDLARKAYERALALDPDNEQAREALENL
jgi:tetratricopeptide (TPR) repeat protein